MEAAFREVRSADGEMRGRAPRRGSGPARPCRAAGPRVLRYVPVASRTAGTISLAQRASASPAGVSSVLR